MASSRLVAYGDGDDTLYSSPVHASVGAAGSQPVASSSLVAIGHRRIEWVDLVDEPGEEPDEEADVGTSVVAGDRNRALRRRLQRSQAASA